MPDENQPGQESAMSLFNPLEWAMWMKAVFGFSFLILLCLLCFLIFFFSDDLGITDGDSEDEEVTKDEVVTDDDTDDESDTETDTGFVLPTPGDGQQLYLYTDGKATFGIIAPENATFNEENVEGIKFFTGEYTGINIYGQRISDPLPPNADCSNYTEQYLGHVSDPGIGYQKYTHPSGAEACVWSGMDGGEFVYDFMIFYGGAGYGMQFGNSVDFSVDSFFDVNIGGLDGYLLIDGVPTEPNGQLGTIFSDGFESGDASGWSSLP